MSAAVTPRITAAFLSRAVDQDRYYVQVELADGRMLSVGYFDGCVLRKAIQAIIDGGSVDEFLPRAL